MLKFLFCCGSGCLGLTTIRIRLIVIRININSHLILLNNKNDVKIDTNSIKQLNHLCND